jgi:hypothetical protein
MQIFKTNEELNIFKLGTNERVLLKNDYIQKKRIADIANINMSAGVVDFKVQYKK